MKVENNVDLSSCTTFKIGGTAHNFYEPESVVELIDLEKKLPKPLYIIGGGSNLLINDEKVFENVISLKYFNDLWEKEENGRYKIGASIRLQKVIKKINQDGFGGIEYLYSVPGLIGGAVYMNAGRGKKYNKSLSDYIIEVEVLHNGQRKVLKKEECKFDYRKSIFQEGDYLILSVVFQFDKILPEDAERLCRERIELCKEKQDNSKPNYGSVFCESDKHIMKMFKNPLIGKKAGVQFSGKTTNWMLNIKNGCYRDAVALLERVELVHRLLHKRCEREVKIWK